MFRRRWWRKKYRVFVLYSKETDQKLYRHREWMKFVPVFDEIFKLSSRKAFIRSRQTSDNKKGWLGFGRMPWNEASNEKWTTLYLGGEDDVKFYNTQVWCPDWNEIYSRGQAIDIFLKVDNGDWLVEHGVESYQALIIAFKEGLYAENMKEVDRLVQHLEDLVENCKRETFSIPWAKSILYCLGMEDPLEEASLGTFLKIKNTSSSGALGRSQAGDG